MMIINDKYGRKKFKFMIIIHFSTVCSMKYLVYSTQTINFVFLYTGKHENDDDSILLPYSRTDPYPGKVILSPC